MRLIKWALSPFIDMLEYRHLCAVQSLAEREYTLSVTAGDFGRCARMSEIIAGIEVEKSNLTKKRPF